MKIRVPLMKNGLIPLATTALITLRLTASASNTNAGINQNIFGLKITTEIISNQVMNDIIKIVISSKDFNLLITGVTKTTENQKKNKQVVFR